MHTPILSILILAKDEEKNLRSLLPKIKSCLDLPQDGFEIIIVDADSIDRTQEVGMFYGAKVLRQQEPGYGAAFKQGINEARGDFILTIDADFSHDPAFILRLFAAKNRAELIIASRYVPQAYINMPMLRKILSRILNSIYRYVLSVPIRDLSSGFRLYNRRALKDIQLDGKHFDILMETSVKIYAHGWRVLEVPFHYRPRREGYSHVKLLKFGWSYAQSLIRLWKFRNSLSSADYDDRAFNSRIPLQRYWQRKRYQSVLSFLNDDSNILDLGCGSSKILEALPNAIGLDIRFPPLFFRKRTNSFLVNADVGYLPIKDNTFSTLICSQVIEHLENPEEAFKEMYRVLQFNGWLIIGTPDYNRFRWIIIEYFYNRILPGAHGQSHITKLTKERLQDMLTNFGFEVYETKYVFGAEMIIKARKII